MKTLAVAFLIATMTATTAAATMTCNAQGCRGIPHAAIAYPDGRVRIFPFNNTPIEGTQCTPVDQGRAIDLPAADGSSRIYSTLLAAKLAGRSVYVRTQDDDTPCRVVYVFLD